MKELSGKYVFAPNEVFSDHRLGLIELRVLLTLYSFRDREDEYVYPSRETISRRSGYGKTTVSRAVSKLVKYGWLVVKQNRGPNHYYLKLSQTVTNQETVTLSDTVTDLATVTDSVINSDRSGIETVTESATPELTKNKPNEQSMEKTLIPPCPHSEIIRIYHESLPELPRVAESRWSGSVRAKNLETRWKEDPRHQQIEFWEWFFQTVKTNPHWMGENGRGWRSDLGWLLKRENFDKVIDRGVNAQGRGQ